MTEEQIQNLLKKVIISLFLALHRRFCIILFYAGAGRQNGDYNGIYTA